MGEKVEAWSEKEGWEGDAIEDPEGNENTEEC